MLKVPAWHSILFLAKTNFRCKSANLISGLWLGQFAGFIHDLNNFNRKFSVYGADAKANLRRDAALVKFSIEF